MKIIVHPDSAKITLDFADDDLEDGGPVDNKVNRFLSHVEDVATYGGRLHIPAMSFEVVVAPEEPVAIDERLLAQAEQGFAIDSQV